MAKKWAGRIVTESRRPWLPKIAAGNVQCARCGLPIDPQQRWHLGHQMDRALGGGHETSNLWPEHVRCSTSAGGKLGQALTRGKTTPARVIHIVPTRRSWTD